MPSATGPARRDELACDPASEAGMLASTVKSLALTNKRLLRATPTLGSTPIMFSFGVAMCIGIRTRALIPAATKRMWEEQ
jgi:hypothetical protein